MNRTLAFISSSLMLGIAAGSVAAMYASNGSELTDFFGAMVENANADSLHNPFLRVLVPNLLWPVLILLFSFSLIGIIGIPVCAMFKGFLVSYTVSSIIRVFGIRGIWFALAASGVPNLLYIPMLLFISVPAIKLSADSPKRPQSSYFLRFAIAAAVFTGLAAYQAYIQPGIITRLIRNT